MRSKEGKTETVSFHLLLLFPYSSHLFALHSSCSVWSSSLLPRKCKTHKIQGRETTFFPDTLSLPLVVLSLSLSLSFSGSSCRFPPPSFQAKLLKILIHHPLSFFLFCPFLLLSFANFISFPFFSFSLKQKQYTVKLEDTSSKRKLVTDSRKKAHNIHLRTKNTFSFWSSICSRFGSFLPIFFLFRCQFLGSSRKNACLYHSLPILVQIIIFLLQLFSCLQAILSLSFWIRHQDRE